MLIIVCILSEIFQLNADKCFYFTVSVKMTTGTVGKIESGMSEKTQLRKFPKSVPFILTNIFLERMSTGGIFGKRCLSVKINFTDNFISQRFLHFI